MYFFKEKSFVIYFLIFVLARISSSEYTEEFVQTHFSKYFSSKVKFIKTPNKNEFKIICAEKIYQNDLIFSIPFSQVLKTTSSYPHQSELSQIIKSFHVDENLGETVNLILYSLMKKFYRENNDFIYDFLINIYPERDTLLWWDKNDYFFAKNSLYYFNEVWVDNMIKETDNAISLTQEIFRELHKKYVGKRYKLKIFINKIKKIDLPKEMLEENEIRNTLETIHKSSVFIANSDGKTQPLIIPLLDLLKKGRTTKNFDTSRRCKINFQSNQISNFLQISSEEIQHFSDCEFQEGEEYFILPRTGSSFENFLTYGHINEYETYDLMEVIIQEPISRKQRELLIEIDVMNKNWEYPFFYLDNKRINTRLRDYFVVGALKKNNITLDMSYFKKTTYNIDDIDIYLQSYCSYVSFLEEKLGNVKSTLEKDQEEYNEFANKRRTRFERLKRNVLLLKLFQRIIIDKQLSLANQNILNLLHLKEEYLKQQFLKNQGKT